MTRANEFRRALKAYVEEETDRAFTEVQKKIRDAVAQAVQAQFGGATTPPEVIIPERKTRTTKRGPGRPPEFKKQTCHVAGCRRPHRSKGYCNMHYQKARNHNWPLPAPKNFKPPYVEPRKRGPKPRPQATELADRNVRTTEFEVQ